MPIFHFDKNRKMKKISEAYGEMDVYQKKLNNGMIALQHINIGEKGLFRSRRNDTQIPYTPTWERLILITKEGDIQGEKHLEINIKIDEDIKLNIDALGFINPDITINIVKDSKIIKKETLIFK